MPEIIFFSLLALFLATGSLAFTAIFATYVSDQVHDWRERRRNGRWVR